MADTNLKRGEPRPFDDNDPFAELTRIMARDSRSAADEAETADTFGIDLEKELLGNIDAPFGEEDEYAEAASEAAPQADRLTAAESPEDAVAEADEIAPEAFDDAFSADFEAAEADWDGPAVAEAEAPEPAAQAAGWQIAPVGEPASPAPASPAASSDEDLGLADVDMDFGDLDFSEDEEAAEFDEAADAEPAPEAVAQPGYQSPRWEPAEQGESSLEDELGMLLADAGPQQADAALASEDDAGEWRYEEAAAGPETDQVPHIPLYGRANYASAGQYRAPEPEMLAEEDRWTDEPNWDEPSTDETVWEELVAVAEAPQDDEAVAAAAEAEAELAPEPAADPFAVFSTIAPAAPRVLSIKTPQQPQPFDAVAELDTVDIPEAAVPLQDDLDLPEPEIDDEQAPAAYDEYDAEFAQAFGEMGDSPATVAEAEKRLAQEEEDRFFADALGYGTTATAAAAQYPAASWHNADGDYAAYAAEQDRTGADDLEREIDVSQYGTAAAPAARRRTGIYVAAAVLGVAVIGGLGAFALSFGGGDAGDAPVLVQADNEPLKVKPENPGGTTVPNQDSQVYERVAGRVDDTPPAQERLVSTVEEPVDLAARAETENALPGVDEDIAAINGAGETDPMAKSEERIEMPRQEATGVGATEDLAAVQPRKVRTMVVRPDGTLVPREEPAPAPSGPAPSIASAAPIGSQENLLKPVGPVAEPQQPAPTAAAVAAPAAQAIREIATQPQTAAPATAPAQPVAQQPDVAAAVETVVTPSSGPIVSQRPTDQPAANRPAEQPQQQVAQAAPAQARNEPAAPQPQAPAGEWSMQIASQPTAESAQATYQDLARRYGSIIGSQGVNIVRADIPGKGTYYRVRIPSATRAEAISLCEKYKAAGGSCFVSK